MVLYLKLQALTSMKKAIWVEIGWCRSGKRGGVLDLNEKNDEGLPAAFIEAAGFHDLSS